MTNLLIYGGRIIDSSLGIDMIGSLLVTDGKIAWSGPADAILPLPDYDVLQARGLIVCPGFIDLHCHLREPGFETKETIVTGSQAAARGGFTTICCMPNTNPPLDSKETVNYVKTKASEAAVRVLPIGCVSKQRKGQALVDLNMLASAGAVAFSDDGSPVISSQVMRQALESGRLIIDHCEDLALDADGQINEGVVSKKLGLKGMPAAAEEIIIARDLALAKLTGGRLHIAHVSTEGSVELIRKAKEVGIQVTAEATPHHLTLTEEQVPGYNANAKVNPPLRTERDVKALVQALKENVIDIIATDHAPHTEADKHCEFSKAAFGISVFETALGSLMTLVNSGQISLSALISKLTCEPVKILGGKYATLGTLVVGAPADIAIFDPDLSWVVDTRDFASKGKNTPLAGKTLRGKVMATVFNGKLVYKDDSIKLEATAKVVSKLNQKGVR